MTQATTTIEDQIAPDANLNRHRRMEDSIEGQYYGKEPRFDKSIDIDMQYCETVRGLDWYKNMSSEAEQQSWLIDYMRSNQYSQSEIDSILRLNPTDLKVGYGILGPGDLGMTFPGIVARLYMRRATCLPDWDRALPKAIQHLIKKGNRIVVKRPVGRKRKEVVEDPIDIAARELFDAVDTFFDRILDREQNQTKIPKDLKLVPSEWVKENITDYKVGRKFYSLLCDIGVRIDNYIDGGDPIEGYKMYDTDAFGEFAKILRVFIRVVKERVVYVKTTPVIKTDSGKISRKKSKPATIQAAKVVPLSVEPDSKLATIEPVKVVGAKAVVLYTPKSKTATYIESKDNAVLGIRGTKVVNIDNTKSFTRRLRNPQELISMAKTTRTAKSMSKYLNGLSTKSGEAKVRISPDTMILAVS